MRVVKEWRSEISFLGNEAKGTTHHLLHTRDCQQSFMIFSSLFLALAATSSAVFATDYKTPPAVLFPSNYTSWIRSSGQSRLALIDIPFVNDNDQSNDNVHFYRLDLVGSSDYERGYGHGSLLAKEIVQFVDVALAKYYMSFLLDIDIRLPKLSLFSSILCFSP
jgi:hypothetical protein